MEAARKKEVVAGGGAAPKRGRPSLGKQRIEICFIHNKARRQVTFSKRRSGLFKKASELCLLCGARVAVVVFSPAERPKAYGIGDPSVDDVLRAYAPPLPGAEEEEVAAVWLLQEEDEDDAAACRAAVEALLREVEETRARVAAEQARMDAVGHKVLRAAEGRRFWWEADVEQLGAPELPCFATALRWLRENLQRRVEDLSKTDDAPPPPQ